MHVWVFKVSRVYPAFTLQLLGRLYNRELCRFEKWMLINGKLEFVLKCPVFHVCFRHAHVWLHYLNGIVLHVSPVAKQVLSDLASLLSSGPTEMGNSDETVATACSTFRRLVHANNGLIKSVINQELIYTLADLSANEWVFINSAVWLQWPAAARCLTPLCSVIGRFP